MTSAGRLGFDPVQQAADQWRGHGWDAAADGMAAVTSLMRAQQIMLARVDAVLRPRGLTFARYEVLMLLLFSRRGSLPLRVVGSRLQVHPASVTNAIDRLVAQEYVRRVPHPTDGRATLAELTDAGRRAARQATERLNAEVFEQPGLSKEQVDRLVDVLRALRSGAGDF